MEKLIITTALTGNVPTKKMNPNLPVTPEEIARDVKDCADAGASIFHVHARDEMEKPSLDVEIFKKIVREIKNKAPGVIIQLSTGARAGKDWEDRALPVRLLPEMGSFTTGSNSLPGIVIHYYRFTRFPEPESFPGIRLSSPRFGVNLLHRHSPSKENSTILWHIYIESMLNFTHYSGKIQILTSTIHIARR